MGTCFGVPGGGEGPDAATAMAADVLLGSEPKAQHDCCRGQHQQEGALLGIVSSNACMWQEPHGILDEYC